MLIYDKDEDILTMEDFEEETMIQENTKGENSQFTDSADKVPPDHTLQEEADSLRQQLTDAKMMVQKLQSSLVLQQAKSNSLNSSLQMQLKRNQETLKNERIFADRRLGEVLAHLLFLEGQLKKEQKNVKTVMKQKDDIIKSQQEQINLLTQTNERLVQAVREAYARKGKNGTVMGSFDSCSSESLKENKGKDKSSKTPQKGRFESMKDRLWHHKSALDLTEPESNMKKLRNRMFSSHENLSGLHKKEFNQNRDKKCRSIAGYPECSDFFPEIPEGIESKGDNSISEQDNQSLYENDFSGSGEDSPKFNDVPFQSYTDNSGHYMTSVGSMPILSQRDTNKDHSFAKERPHSMSAMEYISPAKTESLSPPPQKSPQTPTSESNPFKNLKTILKRKGSKSKNKKRNVSISQSPAQEVSVKKHFERYDMS